jgi:hypothetical protein
MEAIAAEKSFATGDRKGHNHAIPDLKVFHTRTDLDNFAHVLMAKDIAAFHGRDNPAIDVQVGAAYGAGGHVNNRISAVFDLRGPQLLRTGCRPCRAKLTLSRHTPYTAPLPARTANQ